MDTGNRSAFENGCGAVMAHPDFAREVWAQQGCAPLVLGGAVLDRGAAAVAEFRAFALGYRLSDTAPAAGRAGRSRECWRRVFATGCTPARSMRVRPGAQSPDG